MKWIIKKQLCIIFCCTIGLSVFSTACGGDDDEDDEITGENAVRMQEFVKDISSYARGIKSDFIIIPQNGIELAFNDTDPDEGIMSSYISAINGVGVEELFYDGSLSPDNERLSMLRKLKPYVTVMVSDFVENNANITDAIQKNKNEGFISFPRSSDNYDYMLIPTTITDENENDIVKLSDAKNYLYLISFDEFGTKQDMISAIAATNYDVVLIDLFFEGKELTSADIQSLQTKKNGAKRLLIAYVSIGSAENYRYYWQKEWEKGNPSWIKKNYEGYPDEFWVEFWHPDWKNIIYGNNQSYIKKIIDAGFDGAYLDNVEAYYFLTND